MRPRPDITAELAAAYEELKILAVQIEAANRDVNKLDIMLKQETDLAESAQADRKAVVEQDVVKLDQYQFVRAEAEKCWDFANHTRQVKTVTEKRLGDRIKRRGVVEEKYKLLRKELDCCDDNIVDLWG